jgi:pyrophosphatase PpaX
MAATATATATATTAKATAIMAATQMTRGTEARPGMKSMKAVLFDLDGTLVDSEELILASFRHATLSVLGYSPPDDVLREMIGIPLIYQMRKIDESRADEMLRVYRAHNNEVHDSLIREFPGTAQALAGLAAAGFRLAVVTSKLGAQALRGLRLFGIDGYFEFVQGSDDSDRHKPDPYPLLLAAKKMGLSPSDCAYVGDSIYDMQAAVAAGMHAVAALWGMFSKDRLIKAGAAATADSIGDLIKLLAP